MLRNRVPTYLIAACARRRRRRRRLRCDAAAYAIAVFQEWHTHTHTHEPPRLCAHTQTRTHSGPQHKTRAGERGRANRRRRRTRVPIVRAYTRRMSNSRLYSYPLAHVRACVCVRADIMCVPHGGVLNMRVHARSICYFALRIFVCAFCLVYSIIFFTNEFIFISFSHTRTRSRKTEIDALCAELEHYLWFARVREHSNARSNYLP